MKRFPDGYRIADRYVVDIKKGVREGSIGIVYICRDTETDQLVALKLIKDERLSDMTVSERFVEEGTIWMQLGVHQHIVHCHAVKHMDPTAYLVLELIANDQYPDNVSLEPWMGAHMPVDRALLYTLQIARGMKYVVGRIPGLVHCDLKPGNVLVNADTLPGTHVNRLCVADFGLLRIVTESSRSDRDQSLLSLGTPEYMAPEQWMKQPVGIYTDVYALGCILYDMLTRRHTRQSETRATIKVSHLNGTLRPMTKEIYKPAVPFLQRSLSLKSMERYQTWDEVILTLEKVYESLDKGPVPPESAEGGVDPEGFAMASSYNAMGIHCAHIGKTKKAIEYFNKALNIFRTINHLHGEGAASGNLGNMLARLGKMDDALRYCEKDLEIARKRDDQLRESIALGSIGEIYRNQGDARRAIDYQKQRLAIVRNIPDKHAEGNALSSLGMALVAMGEIENALDCHEKQLRIARKIKDPRGEGNALCNIGNMYLSSGRADMANKYYKMYEEQARAIGDPVGVGTAIGNQGSVYLALGELQLAIDLFRLSNDIVDEVGDRHGKGIALGNLGRAYAQLGEKDLAIDFYKQRLKIAIEMDDNEGLCSAMYNIGLLYMQKRQGQDAMLIWTNLYAYAREKNLDHALQRLAKLAPKVGLPEGLDGWERLLQGMHKSGNMKNFVDDLMSK